MENKCAPLMTLRLGDGDKVLSDVQKLAKAVCAINCSFPRGILGLNLVGEKLPWAWICIFTIIKLKKIVNVLKLGSILIYVLISHPYKLIMSTPRVWAKKRAIEGSIPISCPRWTAPPWRRR